MNVPLQDLARGYAEIREAIEAAVLEVAVSGSYILGPDVDRFEEDLAALLGVRYAVSCASGTDAILLALAALDIGRGDEVVTSPFSFFSTASAIDRLEARPVFADVDDGTLNVSPDAVRRALGPRTKAIMPVHLYGQPAPIDEIRAVGEEAAVPVVEDSAQAIGASVGDRKVGACGDVGCFSFYPTKNLGAMGDGGAATTDRADLARKMRMLRVHGSEDATEHSVVGFNSRLDTIQAAVLRVKIRHLPRWTEERRRNADFFDDAFSDLPVRTPPRLAAAPSVYHQYTIRTPDRDALRKHLGEKGVGSGVYYPVPLHLQPCFATLGHGPGDFPVAERAAGEVLSIPVFPGLTTEERDHVVKSVRSFYGKS